MSKEQLVQRVLCAEVRIDAGRMQMGLLNDEYWLYMVGRGEKLAKKPFFIDDTANISVMELKTKARRMKAERGLDLIVIDYIQLIRGTNSERGENRQQELANISRSLKALARELNVPVIAISQLSRSVESRVDKKPLMSDLREYGALEQDADLVMLLYLKDYYEEYSKEENFVEFKVAKHRNGPVGAVNLYFYKEYVKFVSVITEEDSGILT